MHASFEIWKGLAGLAIFLLGMNEMKGNQPQYRDQYFFHAMILDEI